MPELTARLRRLRRLPRSQRVAALRSVLPWAVADELEVYAAEAIEHANRTADRHNLLTDVLRAWARLSGEARAAAVAVAGRRLPDRLDELAASDQRTDRRAAADVAASCIAGDTPHAEGDDARLVLLLHRLSEDEGAVQHAALTGLAAALRAFDPSDEAGALVDAAVAEAASRYHQHRCDALLRAIADRAHHAGPRLSEWLNEPSEAGHMALRSVTRRQDPDAALERAVTDLGVPSLAPAAVLALDRIQSDAQRAAPLAQAHLLACRSRTAALGRMKDASALLGEAWDTTLPLEARLGAVRWIAGVPLKPVERVRRLALALEDPEPAVRLRACLALRECPGSPQTDDALRDFAFDADERVAHAALSALATATTRRRREAQRDLFERLEHSAHERVRRLATAALASIDGQERSREDLLAALESDDRARVLDAITRIDRRDLAPEFAAELIERAEAPDPFVAARAVSALTRVPGDGARQALLDALGHPDGRVVASAVETLGAREGDAVTLDAFATSAVARVRAGAIRHALRTRPGERGPRDMLAEMLVDPRASHRLSALWVTERTRQTALAERVAQLVRDDEEREVRRRAERCARCLLACVREGWSAPAAAG